MERLSQPENLVAAAEEAERLGYDTVWVADRLLYPVNPNQVSGYDGRLVAGDL